MVDSRRQEVADRETEFLDLKFGSMSRVPRMQGVVLGAGGKLEDPPHLKFTPDGFRFIDPGHRLIEVCGSLS